MSLFWVLKWELCQALNTKYAQLYGLTLTSYSVVVTINSIYSLSTFENMNVIQEINRINQAELESGIVGTSASWHDQYKLSAWVYIGNLPTQLTEGDVLAVMSQWGEIEDINLVREEDTGKSRGFCFLKYEDSRSCVLAVDNFNGTKILGRSMRVDHVENYRLPKHLQEKAEHEEKLIEDDGLLKAGHAYEGSELANEFDICKGRDLFAPPVDDFHVNDQELSGHDEAKRKRKEERDRIRREREARRQEREEKKRLKRAKKLHEDEKKTHKKRDKKRAYPDSDESSHQYKKRHERKYDSESDSGSSRDQIKQRRVRRYDSDDER
jgi:RNA-binding motif protein, X-linked 2